MARSTEPCSDVTTLYIRIKVVFLVLEDCLVDYFTPDAIVKIVPVMYLIVCLLGVQHYCCNLKQYNGLSILHCIRMQKHNHSYTRQNLPKHFINVPMDAYGEIFEKEMLQLTGKSSQRQVDVAISNLDDDSRRNPQKTK